MDNIDLNINNYTQTELQRFLKLNNIYSNDELNSQIAKFTLKIVDNSCSKEHKEKLLFFINSVKDKLQIKNENNNDEKDEKYSKILSEIIDTKIGNIIKTNNNFNHNPLQYQRLVTSTINSYQEKTTTINCIFNTRFRTDFLNSIPQQCVFYLPQPITNVTQIKLLSIQIPNVMLAFSNAKFTTQIYIKEDVTNYEAIVVIPEGNYDETSFPDILTKCINEQVINPFILPVNYRFFVTIDPHTFYITIKNILYTFTIKTITKYPNTLGKCDIGNQLASTNLSVYNTYSKIVNLNNAQIGAQQPIDINVVFDYNTKNVISDLILEDCIFTVNKYYNDSFYNDKLSTTVSLKSLMKGSLSLNYNLNKLLDILFETKGTGILYVPLKNLTYSNQGEISKIWSKDYVEPVDLYAEQIEYIYKHYSLMTAHLLDSQVEPLSTNTNNTLDQTSLTHNYTLKIYKNKKFEIIQNIFGTVSSQIDFFNIYNDVDKWELHNGEISSIGYEPFSVYDKDYDYIPNYKTETSAHIIKQTLYQMMTGEIIVSYDKDDYTKLRIDIFMAHNPYETLDTFPIIEPLPEDTTQKLTCKEKKFNLSESYNYRFNDLDTKGNVSELSISNTLGYQIGYRLTEYNGLQSYTSESAFDKTSLDYVYFSVDDYNNSYLNHNYGVLPNANILDKNILAIVTIKSPQFTITFDNGSDYIPKLRNYLTPVNITKLGIKLLDPLGNLVDINTNDYSFVLEITKLIDITNNNK